MTNKQPHQKKLVIVNWIDSSQNGNGWILFKDISDDEPCLIRSVGWILKETDEFLHIIPHIENDSDHCCGGMVIPKVAVLLMNILKEPKT